MHGTRMNRRAMIVLFSTVLILSCVEAAFADRAELYEENDLKHIEISFDQTTW